MQPLSSDTPDSAVIRELGRRLQRIRLDRNLSQRELAEEAGVSRATIQSIEDGESITLVSLLRLMRVFGLVEGLERVFPEPVPSPIQRLDLKGRERQRASRRTEADSSMDDADPRGGSE